MLFVPPILDLDGQCGDWTRDRLEEMNKNFVAAGERAFELGLESRIAAVATVSFRNGKAAAGGGGVGGGGEVLWGERVGGRVGGVSGMCVSDVLASMFLVSDSASNSVFVSGVWDGD